MPGTPSTSPRVFAPRFSNADGVDFAGQVNGVVDAFDAAVALQNEVVLQASPIYYADRWAPEGGVEIRVDSGTDGSTFYPFFANFEETPSGAGHNGGVGSSGLACKQAGVYAFAADLVWDIPSTPGTATVRAALLTGGVSFDRNTGSNTARFESPLPAAGSGRLRCSQSVHGVRRLGFNDTVVLFVQVSSTQFIWFRGGSMTMARIGS